MNRGKIIAVEGPSNSGKTSTCQNMKNWLMTVHYCNQMNIFFYIPIMIV